jgi:hypothetical protein
MLALELAELSEAGYDLALTGFEDAEIEALLTSAVADADDASEPDADEPTRQTTCRMRPWWRCPAPAMSGPSARTD